MSMFSKKTARGFTLIELLVVIAIIGILSSVVLASLNTARLKSRDARRIADLKQLQTALSLYFDANSAYPATIDLVAPTYIAVIPTDPIAGTAYSYAAIDNSGLCTSYHLGASFEDTTNKALEGDADLAANTSICSGSDLDFEGDDGALCTTGDAGTACYDVRP